jgi:hypothetical protein
MKGKFTPFFILTTVFIILISACVRPASGGPVSVPTTTGISNPVATQSALMKEIIAGTQTAMAMASSAGTSIPTVYGATPGATSTTGLGTNTPVYPSPTANKTIMMLPTQTQGPPPEIQPTYVSGAYDPKKFGDGSIRIEVIKIVQAQTVTLQMDNFPPDITFTVKMDVYGNSGIEAGQNIYALNGIVVGFTNSGKGGTLQATYTIPDALRQTAKLHILAISMPYFAYAFTDNMDWTKP